MSLLTAFCAAASTQAGAIIGFESLTIGGGAAVNAVMAEVDASKDYMDVGFDLGITLQAVVALADWTAVYSSSVSTYVNKVATARGLTFRVKRVTIGAAFVTVGLEDAGKV